MLESLQVPLKEDEKIWHIMLGLAKADQAAAVVTGNPCKFACVLLILQVLEDCDDHWTPVARTEPIKTKPACEVIFLRRAQNVPGCHDRLDRREWTQPDERENQRQDVREMIQPRKTKIEARMMTFVVGLGQIIAIIDSESTVSAIRRGFVEKRYKKWWHWVDYDVQITESLYPPMETS
ncbi:unnamed protein product [Soboliphyme baturini]|uniref:Reverse transcriptase n=1 Tax=Soboliphyme baturini TaxID=241478 RepID=A0A183IVR0_9BILA|nr:unnamed protein product [Soboliphyme baturini]